MPEKRCTRCILPESYPNINFDDQGVCHICNTYEEPIIRGEEELRRLVGSRKGGKYDCAAMISGGRDSIYLLYYVVKVLGLKTLALNYDNGFREEQAYRNLVKACERLECDLVEFRSKDNINHRIVASGFRTAIPFGPGPCLQLSCRHCYTGGLAFVYSTVAKHNIPLIFRGESSLEHLSYVTEKKRILGFKKPLRYVFSSRALSFFKYLQLLIRQRNEMLPPGNLRFDPRFPKLNNGNIVEVHIYDYIRWDPQETEAIIRDALDWQAPPGSLTSWRFDCHMHYLVDYCHKKALGFSQNVDVMASMVRSGRITRSEAMDLIDRGVDSEEWTDDHEWLARDFLRLPESDIETMKAW